MAVLENPETNPCFGCGPSHARGLRMSFEEATTATGAPAIRSVYVPKADEVGWPGVLHGGLQFFLLYEASYWAALTLGGKVHRSAGKLTYESQRLPRVGLPCTVLAWVVGHLGDRLSVRATTTSDKGAPCGSLESSWTPARRQEVERAGLVLPDYLLEEMDP